MSSGQTEWAIRTPAGSLVRLETDLPAEVVAKVCRDTKADWLGLVGMPLLGDGTALTALYKACLAFVGEEPPDKITIRVLHDALEQVDDSLPEEYDDGLPKEEPPETT